MPLTNTPDPVETAEKPLDPASERLQQRLTRLVRTSGFIMALGLIAVFSVILYRTIGGGGKTVRTGREADITVPAAAGAQILSSSLDNGALAMVVEDGAGRSVVVVDVASGAVLARVRLVSGPVAPAP